MAALKGKHVLRVGPDADEALTTRFCLTFKKQNGFQMCSCSSVCFFLLGEEARALQGIGAVRLLNFQVFPSFTRTTAELSVAVFPLACVFNVQHVSLQLFKHG